jgi:hypothetical protein
MPEKLGQKLLFVVINAIATLAIMFIILAATNLGDKASVVYVDKQDTAIENRVDQKFESHQREHELTDKYLELIMDHWNIQYQDLKDEIDEK